MFESLFIEKHFFIIFYLDQQFNYKLNSTSLFYSLHFIGNSSRELWEKKKDKKKKSQNKQLEK